MLITIRNKKVITFLFSIVVLFCCNQIFAGDSAMCILRGEQDAFFIGKIHNCYNKYCVIDVEKILMGNAPKQVKVFSFTYYGNQGSQEPKVGNYCVLAVDKYSQYYKNSMAYKASSLNYRTLKLEKANIYGEVKDIQLHINNGDCIKADKKIKARKAAKKLKQKNK